MCVNAGTFISVSLSFCDSLYVCMRVEFVCSCLRVYPSVFSFVCSCLVSVCLMCWILSMLLSVPVYAANDCVYLCLSVVYVYSSEHTFICLLLTSIEGCAKVSLHCVFPLGVTRSCSSLADD